MWFMHMYKTHNYNYIPKIMHKIHSCQLIDYKEQKTIYMVFSLLTNKLYVIFTVFGSLILLLYLSLYVRLYKH